MNLNDCLFLFDYTKINNSIYLYGSSSIMAYDLLFTLFYSNSFNITRPKSVQAYVLFHFLCMRLDKISANYEPPTVPKYMLPNTYITCIFVKPFFLFKCSYNNRLKDFLEKLIIQYFRPDEDDVYIAC